MAAHRAPRSLSLRPLSRALRGALVAAGLLVWATLATSLLVGSLFSKRHGEAMRKLVRRDMLRPMVRALQDHPDRKPVRKPTHRG